MLNVRLSSEFQKELERFCEQKHISKSEVVKNALEVYMARENADNPYELGKDLFGQEGSQNHQASLEYKQHVKSKLNEKHSH